MIYGFQKLMELTSLFFSREFSIGDVSFTYFQVLIFSILVSIVGGAVARFFTEY